MIELAGIIILGILAQWVAWKFKIPAILPLILIGLIVGPISTLFTEDGHKIIEPIWNGEKGLFPGDGLYYFVSLAISIILFEGGLTLKRNEIKNVGPSITKLITLGAAVTFFSGGLLAHYYFGLRWELSFLFSALIIVTGPTVISPILRNIPLKKDVSAVLKWEGILIDPIGALVAVLVFEFISVGGGGGYTKTALMDFGKILLFGTTFGFTFAHALAYAINKNFIPHYLLNVVSLSTVLLVFVESEVFAHESGLLAVVVMGMVMGNIKLQNIKELLYFKESLSVLLISILFILLSANVNIEDLMLLDTWNSLWLFLCVVFLVRPVAVFLSTANSKLKFNEKLFISWVGPRGIVAAGIASLFGSKLVRQGVEGAQLITPLVFMIVLGTVLLNATTARFFSKMVGVFLTKSDGILMVGASRFSRLIAQYLISQGRHVVLIDSNSSNIEKTTRMGLEAFTADIYTESISNNIELNDIGFLLSFTGNNDVNKYAISKLGGQFGENGSFRLLSSSEKKQLLDKNDLNIFSYHTDFLEMTEIARNFPKVNEIEVTSSDDLIFKIKQMKPFKEQAPLFVKTSNGMLETIPVFFSLNDDKIKPVALVYLGQEVETKESTS